jgi:hypothetical protein
MRFKKDSLSFPLQVVLVILGTFLISFYPLYLNFSKAVLLAVIIGCLISTLNVLSGYFIIAFSIDKSNKTFFKSIIGGMILRLFGVGAITVLLVKVAKIEMIGFLISMFFFYFIFLILEVLYLNKRLLKRNSKIQST